MSAHEDDYYRLESHCEELTDSNEALGANFAAASRDYTALETKLAASQADNTALRAELAAARAKVDRLELAARQKLEAGRNSEGGNDGE